MTAEPIRNGKVVSITYTLLNEQGKVFEQSDVPVSYVHGGDSGLAGGLLAAFQSRSTARIP